MIAIIDYGLGNLGSVENALTKLGVRSLISSSTSELENTDGLILPGVGAASAGMKNLINLKLDKFLEEQVKKGKPILGVCLGMQLLMGKSEEGDVDCMNFIEGKVKKFNIDFKVPQIGWNRVKSGTSKLMRGIPLRNSFYFVNSYYCIPTIEEEIVGTTEYGIKFCSMIEKKNLFGVQFHPEKSGENGLKLLQNFIDVAYGNNTGNRLA